MFELFNCLILENEIIDWSRGKRYDRDTHLLCMGKGWAANWLGNENEIEQLSN